MSVVCENRWMDVMKGAMSGGWSARFVQVGVHGASHGLMIVHVDLSTLCRASHGPLGHMQTC